MDRWRRFVAVLVLATMLAPSFDQLAEGAVHHTDHAVVSDAGCAANTLDPNDDGSTDLVNLPFSIDFFGTTYSSLYVNNNGNVTFDGPQSSYTPFPIDSDSPVMIAPFLADVDTRGTGSVTYGTTTFGGHPAFCADWNQVGYYDQHTDLTNTFQLLLVSRPDVGNGAFDIIFNYDQIQWETGDASNGSGGLGGTSAAVGYSNGDGDPTHTFEFSGSLMNGAFLDTSPTGLIHSSEGSEVPGRYVLPIRTAGSALPPIAGFHRDFPYRKLGYQFANSGLSAWLASTGLSQADVLQSGGVAGVFSDWNRAVHPPVLPAPGQMFDASQQWLNQFAMSMNHGMCFGMALSGGRFDAGLDAASNAAAGRSSAVWKVSNVFTIPKPSRAAPSQFNREFLRMLADDFVSQFSAEVLTSRARQQDAYSDATSGFSNFVAQLASVFESGVDLYDPTHTLSTGTGNGYAAITIDYSDPSTGERFGHEVLAYSLDQASDGTITLGVWDNNFPNTPESIVVHPDGTWTYSAKYSGTRFTGGAVLALNHGHNLPITHLEVLPLFQATNLTFNPTPNGSGRIGAGSYIDLPPGSSASITDGTGQDEITLPTAADQGSDAGEVAILPSGSGLVGVVGAGAFDVRSSVADFAATPVNGGPLTAAVDPTNGAFSIVNGAASLNVLRGNLNVSTSGAQAVAIGASGNVTITGSGAPTVVTANTVVSGQAVTTTLFNGNLSYGTSKVVNASAVNRALASASPRDAHLHLIAPASSTPRRRPAVLRGSALFAVGTVTVDERVRGGWRPLEAAHVRDGKFAITVLAHQSETAQFRVSSAQVYGFLASHSNVVEVRWR